MVWKLQSPLKCTVVATVVYEPDCNLYNPQLWHSGIHGPRGLPGESKLVSLKKGEPGPPGRRGQPGPPGPTGN